MRVAIISDTHLTGGRELPERCAALASECDAIVHAGDFSDEAALEAVDALGPPLHAVHGNIDSAAVLKRLPAELTASFGEVAIGVVHDAGPATGRLDRLRQRFPDAAAVVFGHSHMPLLEEQDGFQIFNPGSPTQRRRAPTHTMGIATIEGDRISFSHVELD